ncbi:hypothetical protein AMTR_s00012p00246980, partial [Amborella trichopoda]
LKERRLSPRLALDESVLFQSKMRLSGKGTTRQVLHHAPLCDDARLLARIWRFVRSNFLGKIEISVENSSLFLCSRPRSRLRPVF